MTTQKYILGTAIGAIVSFIIAGLLYGQVFRAYFEGHTGASDVMKSEPDVLLIIIGHILLGLLLTLILGRWAGIKTLSSGAQAGAILGALISLTFNVTLLGSTNLYDGISPVITSAFIDAIMMAFTGAAVGWYFGKE